MTSDLVLFSSGDKAPAHLQKLGGALGNDNVSSEDMAVPRINVLQQLSPQVQKNKAEFVKGAEPGHLFNTATNTFHDSMLVVNMYYDKSFTVFRKRELGPMDFQGNHPTEDAALLHLETEKKDPAQYDITETANHYLLLLDETGQPISPAIMSMNKTKLSVSKKWNTELNLLADRQNAPRFGSVWKISSKEESKNNNTWYTVQYEQVGWANAELTARAEKEYRGLTGLPEETKQDA